MSLQMTVDARSVFLADLHVGVIAIERGGQAPLAVPIWYDYDPEIGVWVLTGGDSQKGQALREAGRYSLCAQTEQPPSYRYVSVEGPIVDTCKADLEKHTVMDSGHWTQLEQPEEVNRVLIDGWKRKTA